MEEKNGFIKIRSALMMKQEYIVERHPDGSFTPSPEFMELLDKQTPEFREPIITFINDLVPTKWAIYFTPFTEDSFDARIYCDTPDDYDNIVSVIKERLKNKKFHSYYKAGTVSDIDSQW